MLLESEATWRASPRRSRRRVGRGRLQGQKGKWAVINTRSSVEPFLTYSTRDFRDQVWKKYVNRGDIDDAHDNNKVIAEILKLRAERAKLLGYETHAHWRLEDAMAKTPARAMALMEAVWSRRWHGSGRGRRHAGDREQERREAEDCARGTIASMQRKVRKAKYDLDEDEVKPYLQLEKLREGMFWVAGELSASRSTR